MPYQSILPVLTSPFTTPPPFCVLRFISVDRVRNRKPLMKHLLKT
jgi:hypothetical protein